MASAKGKVVISTEVETAVRDEIDKRAEKEGRSRSSLITRALRFYLAHAPVVRADEIPKPK